ncbi:MAG TPA: hypothetical protein VF115_07505, partial [Acidimicrobiia bacterium]
MTPMAVLAASLSAFAAGLILRLVVPPPRRLRSRVGPYLSPTMTTISRSGPSGPVRSVFGPIVRDVADWVGRRLDRSGAGVTMVRLRRADWYRGMSEERMVGSYRLAQLK